VFNEFQCRIVSFQREKEVRGENQDVLQEDGFGGLGKNGGKFKLNS
jgi:hypothetical protein